MRETKFKLWDDINKKMITWQNEDASYAICLNGEIKKILHGATPFTIVLPKSLIILQYTGLKDKNGREVFEGDILGGTFEGLVVDYCDECKCLRLRIDTMCLSCEGDLTWWEIVENEKELEVIGNKWENPELLDS